MYIVWGPGKSKIKNWKEGGWPDDLSDIELMYKQIETYTPKPFNNLGVADVKVIVES
jgi:hypothetical protein